MPLIIFPVLLVSILFLSLCATSQHAPLTFVASSLLDEARSYNNYHCIEIITNNVLRLCGGARLNLTGSYSVNNYSLHNYNALTVTGGCTIDASRISTASYDTARTFHFISSSIKRHKQPKSSDHVHLPIVSNRISKELFDVNIKTGMNGMALGITANLNNIVKINLKDYQPLFGLLYAYGCFRCKMLL